MDITVESKKIVNNSFWRVISRVITIIIGVFVTAIVAREFGPEKYGEINLVVSIVSIFMIFSTLGVETIIVKDITTNGNKSSDIIFSTLAVKLAGAIVVISTSVAFYLIVNGFNEILFISLLIYSSISFAKAFDVIEYWIQAKQIAKASAIIRISVYVFTAGAKILVVFFAKSLISYFLVVLMDSILIASIMFMYYLRNEKNIKVSISLDYIKKLLKRSWYLAFSGLLVTIYMRIDQVMIGTIIPNRSELGIYSVAVQVATLWYFVPTAILKSFNPLIFRSKAISEESYLNNTKTMFSTIFWVSFTFSIGITIISPFVIVALFGIEYERASSILLIYIWSGIFAQLGTARSTWLLVEELQRYSVVYTSIGVVSNILLNFMLIKAYGAIGAAFATLISQFIVLFIALSFFKDTKQSTLLILQSFNPKFFIKFINNILRKTV